MDGKSHPDKWEQMQRGPVQQASSQICSVKLSSFKRNVTTAAQEWKGKPHQLEKAEWKQKPAKVVTYTHSQNQLQKIIIIWD